MLFAKAVAYL